MTARLKWGLLGTGAIARKFAQGLHQSRTGELAAIGSRTRESAEKFAADFPATAHGSYEALLADPQVDIVYISTPHPLHAQWAIAAARAGKHMLCEKPLTMNHAEAVAVIDAARAHDVFLMEAFMYRCHPQTARLVKLIRDGAIGRPRLVQAHFSFRANFNSQSRLFNKTLGGGGILDVGCYTTSMARLIAGAMDGAPFAEPIELKGVGEIGRESGVDEFAIATLKFHNGLLAQLAAGVRVKLENGVRIFGDDGEIFVPSPWMANGPEAGETKIVARKNGADAEEILIRTDAGIYAVEADHVAAHLDSRETLAMSWEDSLGNMRTLDRWLTEVGVVYNA